MLAPRLTRGNQPQQFSRNRRMRRSESTYKGAEMGSFTPLIFESNGGMREERKMFMKRLAKKLSEDLESYPYVISWLRTRISFEILNSVNNSIRGSRQPLFRNEVMDDFKVNCTTADLLYEIIFIFTCQPFLIEIFIFLYLNECKI